MVLVCVANCDQTKLPFSFFLTCNPSGWGWWAPKELSGQDVDPGERTDRRGDIQQKKG